MGLLRVLLLGSYKWDWIGLDLCVGLLYEHRFAVLIMVVRLDQGLEIDFGFVTDFVSI